MRMLGKAALNVLNLNHSKKILAFKALSKIISEHSL